MEIAVGIWEMARCGHRSWHVVIAHGPARSDGIPPSEGSRIQAAGDPFSKLRLLFLLCRWLHSQFLAPMS